MDRLVWEPESSPPSIGAAAVAAAAAAEVEEDEVPVAPLLSSEDILYLLTARVQRLTIGDTLTGTFCICCQQMYAG